MRSALAAVLVVILALASPAPATACDPYWDWCGDGWYQETTYWDWGYLSYEPVTTWWDEPAYEPAPEPVIAAPDPGAAAAALGLHQVTEVWTGHVTTSVGAVTTYSSTSTDMDAGTWATVVATVSTGEASPYDNTVLGGRTTMSDGSAVAGDIYANYIWNGYELVVNSYVFFQDDAEIARRAAVATPAPSVATPEPVVIAPPAPTPAPTPMPIVASTPAPAFVAPVTDDAPAPMPAPAPAITPPPAPRVVRVGIALAPQADAISRAEVLRGRRVPLWARATVDGLTTRVTAWRLVAGELTALGPVSGSGDEPLLASFESVSPPGSTFQVRLRATVDVPGEGARELDATIDVTVRSPAIVQ